MNKQTENLVASLSGAVVTEITVRDNYMRQKAASRYICTQQNKFKNKSKQI